MTRNTQMRIEKFRRDQAAVVEAEKMQQELKRQEVLRVLNLLEQTELRKTDLHKRGASQPFSLAANEIDRHLIHRLNSAGRSTLYPYPVLPKD